MREILIDWLSDVCQKFKLLSETFFMTINLIDRYLGVQMVRRSQFQLLGSACLFIASKYEEIYPPHMNEYVRVCDRAYSVEELLKMEEKVLIALEFKLTHSSTLKFIERYGVVDSLEPKSLCFARYLAEMSLMSASLSSYSKSDLAASVVYLVNKIFRRKEWARRIEQETGRSLSQVRVLAKELYILLFNAEKSNLSAIRRKFSSRELMEVSKYKIEFRKPIR